MIYPFSRSAALVSGRIVLRICGASFSSLGFGSVQRVGGGGSASADHLRLLLRHFITIVVFSKFEGGFDAGAAERIPGPVRQGRSDAAPAHVEERYYAASTAAAAAPSRFFPASKPTAQSYRQIR